MKKFSFKKTALNYPIGLDIGDGAVRALQLKAASDGKFAIRAALDSQYPQDATHWPAKLDFLKEFMKSINKSSGFVGHSCCVSLPACFTDVAHVNGSESADEESFESDGPFDLFSVATRQQEDISAPPGSHGHGQRIVMAADRAAVSGIIKMLSGAKLNCRAVSMDVSSIMECYLAGMCRRVDGDAQSIMFVDLGLTSAQVVVAHGSNMAFARNLNIDQSNLWADRLAIELVNCLRYHDSMYTDQPIAEAVFIGGRAHDRAACRQLAEAISLPSRVGDPFMLIDPESEKATDISGPQWSVCMGLCLASATGMRKEAVA